MAPKSTLAQLKLLVGQLERDQAGAGQRAPRAGAGTKAGGDWDCPHCTAGVGNFARRTSCFKCGADRRSGLPQAAPSQQPALAGSPALKATRARSLGNPPSTARTHKPTESGAGSQAPGGDDQADGDAVATELALARSYHDWARKLQGAARELELPKAVARLGKAELADKARKPPSERLQSALSRLDHRRRVLEGADAGVEALEAQLKVAKEEQAQAMELLKEAKQEVEVAQQVHAAWGAADAGTPATGVGPGWLGTAAGVQLTGPQRAVLQKATADLSAECPHVADLLLRLLQTKVSEEGTGAQQDKAPDDGCQGEPGKEPGQDSEAKSAAGDKAGPKRGRDPARSRSRGLDPAGDEQMGVGGRLGRGGGPAHPQPSA